MCEKANFLVRPCFSEKCNQPAYVVKLYTGLPLLQVESAGNSLLQWNQVEGSEDTHLSPKKFKIVLFHSQTKER